MPQGRKISTRDEAKRIVLALIQVNGGFFTGKVRLYKAFYGAHLFYWQNHSKYLTGHPIVHMRNGPGIHDGTEIIRELQRDEQIEVKSHPTGPYYEDAFIAHKDSMKIDLTDEEMDSIRKSLDWIDGKSGTELSDELHLLSRTWLDAESNNRPGEELPIYLDGLTDDEYEKHQNIAKDMKSLLADGP